MLAKLFFTFGILLFFSQATLAKGMVYAISNSSNVERKADLGWISVPLTTTQPLSGIGAGFELYGPLSGKAFWDVGVIYLPRGYKTDTEEITWNNIAIPMVARWWADVFTAFVGLQYTSVSGDLKVKNINTSDVSTKKLKDYDLVSSDYGLVYGVGVKIKSLFLEFRLQSGLADVDTTSVTGTSKETQFVLGFHF